MLVNNISNKNIFKYTSSTEPIKSEQNTNVATNVEPSVVKYPYLSFKAMYNVKTKKIDTESERNKLVRQFDDLLGEDLSVEDLFMRHTMKILSDLSETAKRIEQVSVEADLIVNSKTLSQQQKAERTKVLLKEANSLQKNAGKVKPFVPPKEPDEKYDSRLINKFKSAVNQENFNLEKVYQDYYGDLNKITSLDKLKKQYPKIKIPQNPRTVIADKITDTLTRDFYESLFEVVRAGDEKKIADICVSKIDEVLTQSVKKPDEVLHKVCATTTKHILLKLKKLVQDNTFSSIPEFRKNKTAQITDTDTKLLSVNFEKFVLHAIKEQYLERKKPNEIKYAEGNISIPVASLSDKAYKFEKIPEKIKVFMNTARQIEAAKRDYENFDEAQLKERLNFHANGKIGLNEEVLESIIDFDSCKFCNGDKIALFKFLRELDAVYDEKKTVERALATIRKEELRPKETELINKLEKQKAAERYKEEQKKTFELNKLKTEFDNAINLLYANDLNASANTCGKYRPENLSKKSLENVQYLVDIINANTKNDEINTSMVRSKINNWDAYNSLCESEPDGVLLQKTHNYAKEPDGIVDIDRAGSYINNSRIVENYPQSIECLKNKEIVSGIIEKAANDEVAINCLCKFDNYKNLNLEEKTHISNFINMFDTKDTVEKFMLKNIIENEYAQNDTTSEIKISENSTIEATISARAKQQILYKYKFPLCLDFMADFEDALSSFAAQRGSSGIKRTGTTNKAIDYKMELKLKDHDDRLFSSNNDYCFDIFSERGLH